MARGGKTSTSGQGRKPGVPNKATSAAREAIAQFVDGNAHRLVEWLDEVASGVTKSGIELKGGPDPAKAFDMFQSVVEYHIPKLARTEQVGDKDAPIVTKHVFEWAQPSK